MTETKTAQFHNAELAHTFAFGGNATFTLRSKKTGARYTFKFRLAEKKNETDADLYFVSLLTGPDNTSDYRYMGIVRKPQTAEMKLTAKSAYKPDSAPVLAMQYTLGALAHGMMPPGVEIFHEGRCGRCGRALTVPASIESGLGPECATKVGTAA